MRKLKAGLYELWVRIKRVPPKFFQRLQIVSAGLFVAAGIITAKYPELNPVVYVFNKGTDYQDVVRFMTVFGAFNLGMFGAARLPLQDAVKKLMQDKKEEIKVSN